MGCAGWEAHPRADGCPRCGPPPVRRHSPATLGLSLARAATLVACDGPGKGHMPSEYRAARRGDWTDAANYADATIANYLDA